MIIKAKYIYLLEQFKELNLTLEEQKSIKTLEKHIVKRGSITGFKESNIVPFAKIASILKLKGSSAALVELKLLLKVNKLSQSQNNRAYKLCQSRTSSILDIKEQDLIDAILRQTKFEYEEELVIFITEKHVIDGALDVAKADLLISLLNIRLKNIKAAKEETKKKSIVKKKATPKKAKPKETKLPLLEILEEKKDKPVKQKPVETNDIEEQDKQRRIESVIAMYNSSTGMLYGAKTLQIGLLNKIKKSLKVRNQVRADGTQKLILSRYLNVNNPSYESFVYGVRELVKTDDIIRDSLNKQHENLLNTVSSLCDLSPKKKRELRKKLDSNSPDLVAMQLMEIADILNIIAAMKILEIPFAAVKGKQVTQSTILLNKRLKEGESENILKALKSALANI